METRVRNSDKLWSMKTDKRKLVVCQKAMKLNELETGSMVLYKIWVQGTHVWVQQTLLETYLYYMLDSWEDIEGHSSWPEGP